MVIHATIHNTYETVMINTAYAPLSNEVEIQQFQPISENSQELESLERWTVMSTYGLYGHSRAGLAGLAGRMRPAGHQLDNTGVHKNSGLSNY